MRKVIILGIVLLAVAFVGAAGASKLEERDSFCTRCHLAPEVTYYDHSLAVHDVDDPFLLPDLASFHYWDDADFRCIDCHRGDDSLVHRGTVLALAAGDTLTYFAGRADETVAKGNIANVDPNVAEWVGAERFSRRPDILNAGCLKCHQDTLTMVGFENHFHNKLPAALEAFAETGELHYPPNWSEGVGNEDLLQAEETVLTCLDCHRAHVQGFETEFFLNVDQVVYPACVQCHLEAGVGPLDLR